MPWQQDKQSSEAAPAQVVELVVNLDDISAELMGEAQQALLAGGALDVGTTPIGMKKQRPGVMLSVLCAVEDQSATARRIIELTGSFGVRYRRWDRLVLERVLVEVETMYGPVRVKVGYLDGRVVAARPEYEQVRQVAAAAGLCVREAMAAADAAAERWRQGQGAEA